MVEILSLESTLEAKSVKYAEKQNCHGIKINKRGWPDRLFRLNWGYSFYVEFKKPGEAKNFGKRQGEKMQQHIHKQLRKSGTHVYVIDDFADFKKVFEYELAWSNNIMTMFKPFKEYDKW